MQNKSLSGTLMVLGAAVLWGTTGTTQSLVPTHLSAYWIGALRLVVAAAFFSAVTLATLSRAQLRQGLRALPGWSVLLAGASVAGYNLAFFAGVKATGVAIGTAIALGSGPLWAGLLQWLLTRQLPAFSWWLGTLLAVGGGSLMVLSGASTGGAAASLQGIALCLLAGLSYAVYALLNQRLVHATSPTMATLAAFGTAAVLAVPVAWAISGSVQPSPRDWAVVGYLGVVATGMAYLLFSHALRWISSATAVTLALAEPLVAFCLALLVLHEAASTGAFIGLGLVLAGLAVVVLAEVRRKA
jgi:DME family drug/metabolite transporter